ncbi:YecR-like lipofamily protein [Leclercia adecarboxylata]|uniref:YecR-like lipofamily protein n=1 Tax=Leclercia adecarboxylata TaxID=83655 RepID=UPI0021D333DF|nr:YecR-like lipofamily protein [Leclercia adecarboxylata]MCU6674412.1 YecR-like lipofamily protein [Leclercia adecarboxylata]
MKRLCTGGLLLLLAGCSVTRQAEVSSVDVTSGVVMLNYDQAMLQNARYDDYVTSGTATRKCQAMGYSTAMAYGQPVKTCSLISGSLCLNETMTIQYQCHGYAPRPIVTTYY